MDRGEFEGVVGRERAWSEAPVPVRNPLFDQASAGPEQAAATALRLAAIVDAADDAMIGWTLDGTITDWNRGAERLLGYRRADVIGRSIALLIPPEGGDELPRVVARLARGERVEFGQMVRVHANGSRIEVSLTVSPIRDVGGRVIGAATIARDLTERTRPEATPLVSEPRFRAMFDHAIEFLGLLAPDGAVLEVNETALDFAGVTREAVVGQPFPETPWWTFPEDRNQLRRAIAEAATGHRVQFDARHRAKDGTVIVVDFSLTPLLDADGRVRALLPEGRDITERRRGEERQQFLAEAGQALAHSLSVTTTLERIVQFMVPRLADIGMITLVDANGQRTHALVSPVASASELSPRDVAAIFRFAPAVPDDHQTSERMEPPRLIAEMTDDMLAALARDVEHRRRLEAMGLTSCMELPLTARGHTVGTMIMATTTSRRRFTSDDLLFAAELAMRFSRAIDNARLFEAERAAHANAEKLAAERAAMLAQITDGVVIADRAGEIQFVNAVARRLLGMEPGDPFDPDHAAMVTVTRHDGSNLRLRELLAPAALTGQTTISGDWHIQRGNGTVAVVEAMAVPVVTERGEHLGAVLTLHDETTNRALERQKDEFLANVSHDLRTPLATIKTSIGVVLANEPPDLAEPLHRLLVNIDLAADRIGRLVSDLLDLARLQAGRVPVRRVEVDLREIARRSARVIEPLAQGRGQRLVIDLPKKPIVAHIDAGQMERALLNLLSNAHQHGRDGGLIQLRLSLQRAEAIIAVVDDGPGIAAADQERIFERFVRASGRNHTQQSGLGLAIARALVELNGGRIWVDETPGGGATFVIALPTREPPTDRARRRRR